MVIAFALTGFVRLVGGPQWGSRLASVAIIATLLIAIWQLLGIPPWLPRTGMQKLAYVVLVSLLLSVVVETRLHNRGRILALGLAWLTLGYLWLAWPQLRYWSFTLIAPLGLIYTIAIVSLWRLVELRQQGLTPVVMLLLAALGLAGVAFVSGSLSIAQLSAALAAALGGFALWNWPVVRFSFGAVGVIGAGTALLALVVVTFLLTDASPIALVVLVLILFANSVSRRIPTRTEKLRRILGPIYLSLIAAIPAILAIGLAQLLAPTDDAYYQ